MSDRFESRASGNSTTSQLIFGLLFGNGLAIAAVVAFRPFDLVMTAREIGKRRRRRLSPAA